MLAPMLVLSFTLKLQPIYINSNIGNPTDCNLSRKATYFVLADKHTFTHYPLHDNNRE